MDQAESLRRLVLQAAEPRPTPSDSRGKLVLFVGAQPSVGVTTTVMHLGSAWWRRGRSVVVVDANWRAPALQHYVNSKPKATLRDVVQGERMIREAQVTGPGGLPCVLAGRQDSRRINGVDAFTRAFVADSTGFDLDDIDRTPDATPPHETGQQNATVTNCLTSNAIQQIERCAEGQIVLVDGGLVDDSAELLARADHCVLVLPADDEAALACYLQMKKHAHRFAQARTWLVFNHCGECDSVGAKDGTPVLEMGDRLVAAGAECLNLELRLAGSLPSNEELQAARVQQSSERRRFVKSDVHFSNAIDKLAGRLELELGDVARPWSSITLAG